MTNLTVESSLRHTHVVPGAAYPTRPLSPRVTPKKSAIWKAPKYLALVRAGMPPVKARILKLFYDSVPSSPVAKFFAVDASYADAMRTLALACDEWASQQQSMPSRLTHDSFIASFRAIFTIAYGSPASADPCYFTRRHVRDVHGDQLFSFLGDNSPFKKLPKQPGLEKLQRQLDLGWPKPRPSWESRGIFVLPKTALFIDSRGSVYGGRWPHSTCSDRGYVSHFSDHAEAKAWLESLSPYVVLQAKGTTRILSCYDDVSQAEAFAKTAKHQT